MKYTEKKTLACRDAINQLPDDAVNGTLLVGDRCVASYEEGHCGYGYDYTEWFPAVEDGTRVWLVRRTWCAAHQYCAEGTAEDIVGLEDGLREMLDRGILDALFCAD